MALGFLLTSGVVGCTAGEDGDSEEIGALRGGLTQTEIAQVLALVNVADRDVLDYDVALDSRAADNIAEYRNGPDQTLGTTDDNPYDTIAELDAIPYVGSVALTKLVAYAAAQDDGENLVSSSQKIILEVANTASFLQLDVDAAIDVRAAENIVAHRNGPDLVPGTADDDPFGTVAELDAVPYVGKATMVKLLVYGQQAPPPAPSPACLIISESIEAWGTYNKAIELYNCGSSDIELSDYGVCLVRNDDTSCTIAGKLTGGTLAPGAVHTTCRKATGPSASTDPMAHIKDNCAQELPGVMTFNGDDRLVVFHDVDGDGDFGGSDEVTDALGLIAEQPPAQYWKDKVLRRCNLTPFDGVSGTDYEFWDYFVDYPGGSGGNFGLPPTGPCP
jgi:hypothetical protein